VYQRIRVEEATYCNTTSTTSSNIAMSLIYTSDISNQDGKRNSLYVGGRSDAKDREKLRRWGVSHVLNVTAAKDAGVKVIVLLRVYYCSNCGYCTCTCGTCRKADSFPLLSSILILWRGPYLLLRTLYSSRECPTTLKRRDPSCTSGFPSTMRPRRLRPCWDMRTRLSTLL
jgi:hypothetical protein